MIDLHTHILCGMDDGAQNSKVSLHMLRQQQEQGVDTVVLTPHFYRHRESLHGFLLRRDEAMKRLQRRLEELSEEERESLPRMILGAEVAWVPNLSDCRNLDKLCPNNSGYLLLELPYSKWDSRLVDQVYDLMTTTGLTPVLAHLDRFRKLQSPSQMQEILSLDVPVQISSETFLKLTSRSYGIKALQNYAHVVASDCHDPVKRPPNLGDAMEIIDEKLGRTAVREINSNARRFAGL